VLWRCCLWLLVYVGWVLLKLRIVVRVVDMAVLIATDE
jgi:hypothetical protein